jgi:hypothetical protein
MPRLADFPVILVHYPTGAGGWFLSSLLHYSFDQSEPFTFDQVGSGHSNRSIQYINNFYKYFLQTKNGSDIVFETNCDTFLKEDRIAFIKESLLVAPDANKNIPQVISIHCQNINLFLEALPQAKCVQITITEDELLKCTFNYLFKVLSNTPFNFEKFCAERGIVEDQFEIAKEKIKNLNAENLKWFEWAVPFIKSSVKSVDNNVEFKDRILELPYTRYMNHDHELVLEEIIEFANPTCSLEIFEQLAGYVLSYRLTQPRFPL